MNEDTAIYTLALQFRNIGMTLYEQRQNRFPNRCIVRLDNGQYGLATINDGCPPDKLPVRFENGNTWWKPIEQCTPIALKDAPRHVQRMKLELTGYRLLRRYYKQITLP